MNEEDLNILQREWALISNAPFEFIGAVLVVGIIIWRVLKWYYEGQVKQYQSIAENRSSQIDLLRQQIEEQAEARAEVTPAQGRSAGEKSAGYNPTWDKVDAFALWQAAWLWVGEEPKPEVRDGTPAYPVLRMLKAAADAGTLNVTREQRRSSITWGRAIEYAMRQPVNAWAIVTRRDLKEFADSKGEYPDFLQE